MLTAVEIGARERAFSAVLASGRIVLRLSRDPAGCDYRILAMTPAVLDCVEHPWGGRDDPLEARRHELLAACDAFSQGINMKLLMKRLSARPAIAEFRVMDPTPGTRAVGAFLTEDVFVMTSVWLREQIASKRKPSTLPRLEWRDLKDLTKAQWDTLFPDIPPVLPHALR